MRTLDRVGARPVPPAAFAEPEALTLPAPDLLAWARQTFIDEDALLVNPDHEHLQQATLGMLWTNVPNGRAGRVVLGQCEFGLPRGNRWATARAEQQMAAWFGTLPDFVLTFDANYAGQCSDAEFCALVEHELYHAGQARDEFGNPKFRRDGRPTFTLRGHDVEEFVGVVRRYGAAPAHVDALIEAARQPPTIAALYLKQACGTCLLRAA